MPVTIVTNFQRRLMQTYRVNLVDHDDAIVASADVNLSFEMDEDNEPISLEGLKVDRVHAHIELARRLRKLANKQRVAVSVAQLDDENLDWATTIVRQRFVTIPTDPSTGRPIPKEPRS